MTKPGASALAKALAATGNIYAKISDAVPAIKRGQVWCRKCGHTEKVDGAHCLAHGWPKHCGETMTIDAPKERC